LFRLGRILFRRIYGGCVHLLLMKAVM
jgi:hypothetical protein